MARRVARSRQGVARGSKRVAVQPSTVTVPSRAGTGRASRSMHGDSSSSRTASRAWIGAIQPPDPSWPDFRTRSPTRQLVPCPPGSRSSTPSAAKRSSTSSGGLLRMGMAAGLRAAGRRGACGGRQHGRSERRGVADRQARRRRPWSTGSPSVPMATSWSLELAADHRSNQMGELVGAACAARRLPVIDRQPLEAVIRPPRRLSLKSSRMNGLSSVSRSAPGPCPRFRRCTRGATTCVRPPRSAATARSGRHRDEFGADHRAG